MLPAYRDRVKLPVSRSALYLHSRVHITRYCKQLFTNLAKFLLHLTH